MSDIQYRSLPTFTQQWTPGNVNDANWYRWSTQTENGTPPSSESAVTIGASPFTYTAPEKGFLVVSGGTITSVMISRIPNQFYLTGQTAGMFPLSQNDSLKFVFTGKPIMTFFPT